MQAELLNWGREREKSNTSITVHKKKNIYIYIYVCMYVCMYDDCHAKVNLEHTQLIYRDGMANQCYIALNTIIEWFIYGLPRKKFDSSL